MLNGLTVLYLKISPQAPNTIRVLNFGCSNKRPKYPKLKDILERERRKISKENVVLRRFGVLRDNLVSSSESIM